MVQALALGIVLLALLLLAGRWFATSQPAAILRGLKWGGIAVGGAALVGLAATGRLSWLLAAFGALLPWLARAMYVRNVWRQFRGAGNWRTAGSEAPPKRSQVESAYLRMSLDHDTGKLDGEVLQGPLRGRRLCQLAEGEALALWREVQPDPQSVQLLEAWLDQVHPDWRQHGTGGAGEAPPSAGRMTREEAYSILGLEPGADAAEIKAAHHRLMMACHPDRGGSDWLAARLNQARDVLLQD